MLRPFGAFDRSAMTAAVHIERHRPPARHHSELLQLGRRIAAELMAAAVDPDPALTAADRKALAILAVAVNTIVARRTGAEPFAAEITPLLAEALAWIEAAA